MSCDIGKNRVIYSSVETVHLGDDGLVARQGSLTGPLINFRARRNIGGAVRRLVYQIKNLIYRFRGVVRSLNLTSCEIQFSYLDHCPKLFREMVIHSREVKKVQEREI